MKKPTESLEKIETTEEETVMVLKPEEKDRPFTKIVQDFTTFLRDQGIVGLAVAVVLGAAVTRLVGAFVADIINPFVGVLVGAAGDLSSMVLKIGPIEIRWGSFVTALIDFLVVVTVIYAMVRVFKLDRLVEKKK